jgi:hypothetical protein
MASGVTPQLADAAGGEAPYNQAVESESAWQVPRRDYRRSVGMNSMAERDLDLHVKVLGWLFVLSNALMVLLGVFTFLLLPSIGVLSGDREAMAVLSIVGPSLGVFFAVLGLPGMLAGIGLLRRAGWARVLAIIVAILGLVNVPIGTLVGVYALYVLLQQSATEYFGGHR